MKSLSVESEGQARGVTECEAAILNIPPFMGGKEQLTLHSCGIAECLRSFPSVFEHPSIPVVR